MHSVIGSNWELEGQGHYGRTGRSELIPNKQSDQFQLLGELNKQKKQLESGFEPTAAMVEGPFVHRQAEIHRHLLLGKRRPLLPRLRAADLQRAQLQSMDAICLSSKFTFFTSQKLEKALVATLPDDVVVGHIHFGLIGYFHDSDFPGPEPKVKTRLRLQSEDETVDTQLTASVCVHGDLEFYRKTIAKLGPDPLRFDADKELLWGKMQKTRKTVGVILMDQSLVAGVGNVLRSEILFTCGFHPNQRASTLSRAGFEELWERSTGLFMLALMTGSLATVYPEDEGKPYRQHLKTDRRYYAYGQSFCKVCEGAIKTWPCAGRKVYACEVCQPLRKTNKRTVDKTLVEDAVIGQGEALEPQSGLIPHEKNLYPDVSDNRGTISSLNPNSRVKSMTDFRTRRVVADKIADHQPFMNISREGRRNDSSTLADLSSRYDFLQRGSFWTSASERAGLPRKHHLQASHFGKVVHGSISWSPSQTFTKQVFPTRRVGYITLRALAAAKPQELGCTQ